MNGIYQYDAGAHAFVYNPGVTNWSNADMYVNMDVPVAAHQSPQYTGINAYASLTADVNDHYSDIAQNNRLFTLTVDNTLSYQNYLNSISLWS